MRQNWPQRLWLVRHGQSHGNVARDRAHAAGHSVIDLDVRDVDVPLSELGERQAVAAGKWFADLPPKERPEVILSSPYLRARQTATAICDAGALAGDKAKSVIDTFCTRIGDVLQAVVVFVGTSILGLGVWGFAWLNVMLTVAWLAVAVQIAREHRKKTV